MANENGQPTSQLGIPFAGIEEASLGVREGNTAQDERIQAVRDVLPVRPKEGEITAEFIRQGIKQSIDFPGLVDTLNEAHRMRMKQGVPPEVSPRDIVKDFFSPTAPIDALSREDIFPGITEGLQVGSISTPTLGTTPIFFGGGGLFPFEFINSRRRAIDAAAAKSAKEKSRLLNALKPPQTAEQFQNELNNDFFNYIEDVFEQTKGNEQILNDPTNPFTQRFFQALENFNTEARWGTRLNQVALDVRAAFDDPERVMTKGGAEAAEKILLGDIDFEKDSIPELLEVMQKAQSISTLMDSSWLKSIKPKVRSWLSKIPEASDLAVKDFDIIKKMKQTFLTDAEITDIAEREFAINGRDWKANGQDTVGKVRKFIADVIDDKLELSIAGFRTEFGGAGGRQKGSNIYERGVQLGKEGDNELIRTAMNPQLSNENKAKGYLNTFSRLYNTIIPQGQKEFRTRIELTPEAKRKAVDETVSDLHWFDETENRFIKHDDYINIINERESQGKKITPQQKNIRLLSRDDVIGVKVVNQNLEWQMPQPDGTFKLMTTDDINKDPRSIENKRVIYVNEYDITQQIRAKERDKLTNLIDAIPGVDIDKGFPKSIRLYDGAKLGTTSILGDVNKGAQTEYRAAESQRSDIVTELLQTEE